jgi:hypothetical protein
MNDTSGASMLPIALRRLQIQRNAVIPRPYEPLKDNEMTEISVPNALKMAPIASRIFRQQHHSLGLRTRAVSESTRIPSLFANGKSNH